MSFGKKKELNRRFLQLEISTWAWGQLFCLEDHDLKSDLDSEICDASGRKVDVGSLNDLLHNVEGEIKKGSLEIWRLRVWTKTELLVSS